MTAQENLGLAFPVAEYRERLRTVQAGMEERGLEAALIFGAENLFHLTGYESIGYSSFQLALVPAGGEPRLLVRELERPSAERGTWMGGSVPSVEDGQDPIDALVELLRTSGLAGARLGVDRTSSILTVAEYLELAARLPEAELADGSGLVERARRIKSPLELDHIRQAARYTEAGMRAGIDAIHEGALDNEAAAEAARAIYRAGSEYMTIAPIVTSGARSGIAHTTFRRTRIDAGDAVLLEIGAVHRRYTGPLMRSAVVGRPGDEIRRMYDACSQGLDAAIAAIRPGAIAGDVHDACQRVIDEAGFTALFRKRLGYSVGVGFAPDWGEGHIVHLSHGDPTPLEPGMVFHMPPALRQDAVAGVGCSETVAVTEEGVEVLTSFPRPLAVR
ncbi:MAG TPA: Xaa-Pro peptidase family protein [Candidatus Dormibacteraeota bacterium]|jgi:Xaa-Pro dipeptidase|nr:Xaa-Pro peptidase family protein [Candidatus Dormibacteraeota bacterium]